MTERGRSSREEAGGDGSAPAGLPLSLIVIAVWGLLQGLLSLYATTVLSVEEFRALWEATVVPGVSTLQASQAIGGLMLAYALVDAVGLLVRRQSGWIKGFVVRLSGGALAVILLVHLHAVASTLVQLSASS